VSKKKFWDRKEEEKIKIVMKKDKHKRKLQRMIEKHNKYM
jgi:hypothetical protein